MKTGIGAILLLGKKESKFSTLGVNFAIFPLKMKPIESLWVKCTFPLMLLAGRGIVEEEAERTLFRGLQLATKEGVCGLDCFLEYLVMDTDWAQSALGVSFFRFRRLLFMQIIFTVKCKILYLCF